MPPNIVASSTSIQVKFVRAFIHSGFLNAGTPSEIASTPVSAAGPNAAGRVRLAERGVTVTFTVANKGPGPVVLDDDFHLFLDMVTAGGRAFAGAVFVFPAPGLDTIAPGGTVTFQVPIGDAVEGEPGRDLSAHRLLLEAEVFLVGQDTPIVRHFTFPGCG
jgi:hypothetical protein